VPPRFKVSKTAVFSMRKRICVRRKIRTDFRALHWLMASPVCVLMGLSRAPAYTPPGTIELCGDFADDLERRQEPFRSRSSILSYCL